MIYTEIYLNISCLTITISPVLVLFLNVPFYLFCRLYRLFHLFIIWNMHPAFYFLSDFPFSTVFLLQNCWLTLRHFHKCLGSPGVKIIVFAILSKAGIKDVDCSLSSICDVNESGVAVCIQEVS